MQHLTFTNLPMLTNRFFRFFQASRYCTVKQLNEGLIGKIVRYKSGKSKLIIGQTRFDIDLGMDPGLLQVCREFLI